tara:strand:+ start:180 stop:359 length:180 start_codon:yes stop_codon:yes gene_type:complete
MIEEIAAIGICIVSLICGRITIEKLAPMGKNWWDNEETERKRKEGRERTGKRTGEKRIY